MGILQGTHWFIQWAAQEAIDSGNCSVRIFFADFAKCFDIIDHSTLLDELRSFNVDQLCFFGYAASLPTEHKQCASAPPCRHGNKSMVASHREKKLGLTLFTVMINKLLINWHMRTKYADDTTAFEIIPNSFSMLVVVIREIHDYWIEHKMKLNPKKRKEMYIYFMKNSITAMRPLSVGNQGVERVGSYKLLGVILSDDLKWNAHVEYCNCQNG